MATIGDAVRIMGTGCFSKEQTIRHMGCAKSDWENAFRIPYESEDLKKYRDTCFLVPSYGFSILEIRSLVGSDLVKPRSWFDRASFASHISQPHCWLVKKKPDTQSKGLPWEQQIQLVYENELVAPADLVVYAATLYYRLTKRLLLDTPVRTSTLWHGPWRVTIGQDHKGIRIGAWNEHLAYRDFAILKIIKPKFKIEDKI